MKSFVFFCILFLSTPIFAQWEHLSGPYGCAPTIFASVDNDSNFMLVGTQFGLYRTTDGGQLWYLSRFSDSDVSELVCVPTAGQDVFIVSAASVFGLGGATFRSLDSGKSWEVIPNGHFQFCVLGDTIFANGGDGIYRSFDAGSTWSKFSPLPNDRAIKLFTNNDYLFEYLYDTTIIARWNVVRGWDTSSLTEPLNPAVFAGSGSDLYTTSPYGIEYSENNGLNWKLLGGLPRSAILSMAVVNSLWLVADGASLFLSTDSGNTWNDVSLNNTQPNNYIFSVNNKFLLVSGDQMYRSSDGVNWDLITNGIAEAGIRSIASLHDTLYASAANGVVFSTDRGISWPASNIFLKDSNINTLSVANDNVYVCGDGFWKRDPSGNWISPTGDEIEDPTYDSGTWYGILNGDHIGKSIDDGKTWQDITGNLPIREAGVFVRPGYGHLYVYNPSDTSFYVSLNKDSSWTFLSKVPSPFAWTGLIDSLGIFVVGEGLISSSDSGRTWTTDSALSNTFIYAIQDLKGGIVVGAIGRNFIINSNLVYSPDGHSWIPISPPIYNISSLTFDDQYVYVGSWQDGIWRAPISSLVTNSVIESQIANASVSVFPNPTAGLITVTGALGMVTVENMLGECVLRQPPSPNPLPRGEGITVDLSNEPAGIYFITVGDQSMKVVKE